LAQIPGFNNKSKKSPDMAEYQDSTSKIIYLELC
jgi:hypothetical protein